MWAEVSFWLGLAVFGVLPGWLLLAAVRPRWTRSEWMAAAPGLSLAAMALCAYLAELVGWPVVPWAALTLLAVLSLALYALRRWFRPGVVVHPRLLGREPWHGWLVLACPVVLLLALQTLRSAVILPPTVDDGVHHATWTRLIYERFTLSPSAIYAYPVSATGPIHYPWGLHGWIALLARSVSLDFIETYWRAVLVLGSCLPLSVYVLAGRALPRGWPSLSAAVLSCLFYWMPFHPYLWGGLPMLAGALCALPIARLAVDALQWRSGGAIALAGLSSIGVLLVHPSQAMGALLIAAVLALAAAVSGCLSWRVVTLFSSLVALTWLAFAWGPALWPPLRYFMAEANSVAEAMRPREPPTSFWLAELYLGRGLCGTALSILCWLGLVVAVFRREFRLVLALHVALLLLLFAAPAQTWLTALWYHSLERLWYLQIAAAPLLGAAGMWGVVWLLRRQRFVRAATLHRSSILWLIALAAAVGSSAAYERNVRDKLTGVSVAMASDPSHVADFAWLGANVPKGTIILNAPGDWGLVLPFTGHWLAFTNCLGRTSPRALDWAFWRLHNLGGYDRWMHERVRETGIRFVYAGIFRPFGVNTVRGPTFDTAALARSPALDLVYSSRTARIYRLRETPELASVWELSLGQRSPVSFDGFPWFTAEYGQPIRWTSGHGVVQIPSEHVPTEAGCQLLLGLRRPPDFPTTVRYDGRVIYPLFRGVYRLPPPSKAAGDAAEVHTLELESPTYRTQRPPHRRVGLGLYRLAFQCPERDR